jgi:DNA-nicking Smr family endonuclease
MDENREASVGPVVIPIEDHLDLHSFPPKEVKAIVEEYLFQCFQKGLTDIRIIHGRGTGQQRNLVRALLAKNLNVLAFSDAPPEAGGWGATLVHLKSNEPSQQAAPAAQ